VDSNLLPVKMGLLNHSRCRELLSVGPRSEPTAIRTDLGVIFVSMELGRTNWLITSLSPGASEKMSKHSTPAEDVVLRMIYPIVGVCLAALTFTNNALPLLYPLASGFALIGPLPASGFMKSAGGGSWDWRLPGAMPSTS